LWKRGKALIKPGFLLFNVLKTSLNLWINPTFFFTQPSKNEGFWEKGRNNPQKIKVHPQLSTTFAQPGGKYF